MADQDVPMPGPNEFSADEEKQMRQARAAANGSYVAGTATATRVNKATGQEETISSGPLYVRPISKARFQGLD